VLRGHSPAQAPRQQAHSSQHCAQPQHTPGHTHGEVCGRVNRWSACGKGNDREREGASGQEGEEQGQGCEKYVDKRVEKSAAVSLG